MRLAWPLLSTSLLVLAVVPPPASSTGVALVSEPVLLDPAEPAHRTVGHLRYEGGLVVRAADERMGGLSSLRVGNDGASLLAVSDCGDLLAADIQRDAAGQLSGLDAARLIPLIGEGGRALGFDERDSEGLAREASGAILISFEGRHRVWRYPPSDPPCRIPPIAVDAPSALARLPYNSGVETVVSLSDGRILLVAEGESSCRGSTPAWIGRDGAWKEMVFPIHCEDDSPKSPFRPTDAVSLPDGDLIVLERRFPPVGARLRRISPEELSRGDLLGHEVALLETPLSLDNFEGVDAWRTSEGETRLLLLSDDNNCLKGPASVPSTQRTLLLEFTLVD